MCEEKTCSRCKETKPVSEFHKNSRRKNAKPTWADYKSFCKVCNNLINQLQKEKYPHHWIATRFKISKEEAHHWYLKSMQTCDICGTSWEEGSEKFCIDHCHSTGAIRGILCKHCNYVLGHSYDSVTILENSIRYLRERG